MSLSPAHVSLAAGLSLSLLTCVAVADSSGATAPDGAAVEILPPGELWEGVTRGEWDAQWWQRVFTMPEEINPYFDPTGERCGYQQSGPAVILPGNFAGGIVERTCVVAEGTAIYVHVAGATCSTVEPPPYYGRTEDELRACASASFDNDVIDFEARVDGQDVADLNAYRTTSPMFTITSPVDNPLGIEPGVGQMVSEAISFIIAPPPPGEYEIEVSQGGGGVTNTIIVEAPNAIDTPMSSPVNSAAVSSWEPGAIEWTETRPGFEEGYLDVPIDYAHPDDGMLHGST